MCPRILQTSVIIPTTICDHWAIHRVNFATKKTVFSQIRTDIRKKGGQLSHVDLLLFSRALGEGENET